MYIVTLQGKIAVTNTPQQLTANALQIGQLTLAAKAGNTASMVVVNAPAASAASDGTGVGYILAAGTSITLQGPFNTNEIYISGTSGDVYSGIGT